MSTKSLSPGFPTQSQKAKASALRKQGNDAYKARRFDEAIETYTKALEVSPVIDEDCAVFYCNRAACYLLQVFYSRENLLHKRHELLLFAM